MKEEKTTTMKIFLWQKEDFIRLHQKSGRMDFNKLWDTVSILNEGTNSLVMSHKDGLSCVDAKCAIKFTVAGSQD